MKQPYVYIMSNRPSGTLYIGVTANLPARIYQHRAGTGSDFCRDHQLTRLVHAEPHATMIEAIAREKALKAWNRAWKLNLIGKTNPDWRDLFDEMNA